jgi:hypothetical protein
MEQEREKLMRRAADLKECASTMRESLRAEAYLLAADIILLQAGELHWRCREAARKDTSGPSET